jgi:hypothetical protein
MEKLAAGTRRGDEGVVVHIAWKALPATGLPAHSLARNRNPLGYCR